MADDLLTRIEREMDERLEELRGVVDEHDRLSGELSALQDIPEPPVDLGPAVAPELAAAPELPVASEPKVAAKPSAAVDIAPELPIAHEPSTNVVRLPARRPLSRTRMVSPKVARLMRAPRRPALERPGVVRVGAARLDSSRDEPADDVDVEAEVYERSL
jgi:hypothetical protein